MVMMMKRVLLASCLVLCLTALQASVSYADSFAVVHKPEFVTLNTNAPLLAHSQVEGVVKSTLGLNTEATWAGVGRTNPFDIPEKTLHISVSGCDEECVPEQSEAKFPVLSSLGTDASDSTPLAAHVKRTFGEDSYLPTSSSVLSANEIASALSSLSAVPGVEVDGTRVRVAGSTFDTATPANRAVVSALLNILSTVDAMATSDSKAPRVFAPAVDLSLLPSQDHTAAAALVRAAIAHAASRLTRGASASLTTVLCTSTTATAQQQRVVRRDAGTPDAGTPDAAIVRNNANLTPRDSAWVEHCTEYQCFCSTDSNGDPWDPDTRCQKNCDVDGNKCECVYLGCDCETGKNVMKTQSKCKTCKDGFVVIGNHCYLDSDMPVAVNIILGLGIVSFVSLLLTCIALGNMDPGYDSIIYRMTQQRIKSQ